MDSEDFPSFYRNQALHLLLDVLTVRDEEDESLSSKPRTRRENVSQVQYRSNSFSMGMILDEESASSLLCGFAFAFDRLTKFFCIQL